ncbi:hypothetical protein M409DRAFT_69865 [Zasmidium cellare ATCC 36951]|uniref:Uncharacterized protein n=1 Tax=Zasmidium cellare ATCC 36951 TaxID=1080233 RepID=A0A6A6C797_ZASCE|nr:uncharacterized protein M409DRAFT_69865 [Zasmidium cellare ATCC 36951]KAF2161246.1 hypothetical protein M409DRAFT_69865 [Zasmidium cellare ATCC 36951]
MSAQSSKLKDLETPRRALAELQYNSILASDQGTSSDEEAKDNGAIRNPDDAREAIGISIGREQTRLISPRTPATEKAAALESAGGFFGAGFDGIAEGDEPEDGVEEQDFQKSQTPPVRASPDRSQRPGDKLPSPWRADVKHTRRSSKSRSVLRDGFSFRRRASSGPEQGSESFGKSFFSSFPSMSKNFSISSPFASTREDINRSRSPKEEEEAQATIPDLPTNANLQLHQVRSRPQPLRRSTSDTSLITQRTLSRVSSLGDDSRFEHVSEQVNSRFKAIKDSFHDSSIRLPSMPSMSSFSHFAPDFMNRERSSSDLQDKSPPKPVDPMTRRPYSSAKAAISDAPQSATEHPHFTEALNRLEGDIVILGGYRGSILRSAEPPHRQLWVPIKVGLNIRKVDLEVGIDENADERATETVIPGGMLTHIGPVDMSRRLFKRLRACENARTGKLRVHDYGYDWRLHPHHLSKKLIAYLESLPSNQPSVPKGKRGAIVVAHSLGGLITRHAVNQRPELFRGVVYAGVPQTCVNILGPLRNGDEVLLSSRVLTAQVNFTIRTSFALLPLDGRCFIDKNTKEEYPVDFFDPQTWIDCRLSPVMARPLPPLSAPPKPTGLSGYVSSMASALPSLPLPGRKNSSVRGKSPGDPTAATIAGGAEAPDSMNPSSGDANRIAIANGNIARDTPTQDDDDDEVVPPSVRTAVTLPREQALDYLTRTLATVKQFKEELAFKPEHHASNIYPPISAIYGKSVPTVIGAKVDGCEGIKHADAYDELAFASGDGVVLARAAMVPEGYRVARGGVASSERGHVTLLGDLEAVGRCLNAIINARGKGVGLGK